MDRVKVGKLVTEYGKNLYSFCLYTTKDRETADDLYQQTFLTVMEKEDVRIDENPKAYLITVAMNIWKNRIRKILWRKKIVDVSFVEEEELFQIAVGGTSVEEEVVKRQEGANVRREVLNLPEKLRVVILMFYMENMSIEEIASALKIPTGTVKSRMSSAKSVLKERLIHGK